MQTNIEFAALTTTSVIISAALTVFTLSALYQGLQNMPYASTQEISLKSQTFFCLLIPVVVAYYIKLSMAIVNNLEDDQELFCTPLISTKSLKSGITIAKSQQPKTKKIQKPQQPQKPGFAPQLNKMLFSQEPSNEQVISVQSSSIQPGHQQGEKQMQPVQSQIEIIKINSNHAIQNQVASNKVPNSPMHTDSTDEPTPKNKLQTHQLIYLNSQPTNMTNFQSNEKIFPKQALFSSKTNDLKDQKQEISEGSTSKKKRTDPLPFNGIELYLFINNIVLCLISKKENSQIDLLLSIAILILVYFIILQTFCAGRRNIERNYDDKENEVNIAEQQINNVNEDTQLEKKKDVSIIIQQCQNENQDDKKIEALKGQSKSVEKVDQAYKFIQELIKRKHLKLKEENKEMLIVRVLDRLRMGGEAVLRWCFFTLNTFLFALAMIQNQ